MKHLPLLALCLFLAGCVTKYDDISSNFHTIQNGPLCTTVAMDQVKFNAETKEPDAITCLCSQVIAVKRLVVKPGESPEGLSCPAPAGTTHNSTMLASVNMHHQRSNASVYVPAVADLAGMTAIGVGLSKSGARLTQSVGGLTINEQFSTKFIGK